MNPWNKCLYCKKNWKICRRFCENHDLFEPDAEAIIIAAKGYDISVADVIKLIEYCGD